MHYIHPRCSCLKAAWQFAVVTTRLIADTTGPDSDVTPRVLRALHTSRTRYNIHLLLAGPMTVTTGPDDHMDYLSFRCARQRKSQSAPHCTITWTVFYFDVQGKDSLEVPRNVAVMQSFGLNRAVMLLKGSKSKQVEPWMQQLTGPDGSMLHGAGSSRSEEWWKGLANVLMGQGLLASQTKSVRRSRTICCSHLIFRCIGCICWVSINKQLFPNATCSLVASL